MNILLFLLITISLSQLWSHSKVMSPLRIWITKVPIVRNALLCPPCSSFWVAFGFSFLLNPLVNILPVLISNIAISAVNYCVCGILFKNRILTDD